ncbi:MAG: type II toxin-antitoxin system Phd/YefM family antitoxin [Terriglobales bacterium]
MTMNISWRTALKTMAAGSFKARCLAVMDEVQAKREAIVITKRGKPVVKLVPADAEKDDIFGFLRGKAKIVGDIVSPALTPEEWGDLY